MRSSARALDDAVAADAARPNGHAVSVPRRGSSS
jgi:hypothetical protein